MSPERFLKADLNVPALPMFYKSRKQEKTLLLLLELFLLLSPRE
jgi:hypothetical protein